MRIAKSAKRLLSALTVTTLLVSGIVVAPKAKAAEGDPAVVVKGATLRLDGNDAGKQSMRIGVEVSNASKATECGIELDVGGTKTTISTADTKYQKIYDKNEAQDKIIYTVVIKNIPSDKFDTSIKATGLVKATGATENTKSTENVEKTVTSLVSTLEEETGATYSDGAFWVDVASYDFEGENADFRGFYENPGWTGCSKIEETEMAHGGSKALSVTTTAEHGGIKFPELPGLGEYELSCYVKKVPDVEGDVQLHFRSTLANTGLPTVTLTDEWQQLKNLYNLTDMTTENEFHDRHSILRVTATEGGKSYLIDDVKIRKKVSASDLLSDLKMEENIELSASSRIDDAGAEPAYNTDGSVTVKLKGASGGLGILFALNKLRSEVDLSKYSKAVVNITSEEAKQIYIQFKGKVAGGYWQYNSSPNIAAIEPTLTVGTNDYEIPLGGTSAKKAQVIFIRDRNKAPEEEVISVKINSIKLVK